MRDLLKADLRRVLKDKLVIVLLIIAGVFAITTPLLYKLIFEFLDMGELLEMEGLGLQMTAKSLFFTSFSPGNNFGLILPILVAIIICRDFSNGTIRNKVICGKSRSIIYFSMLITCAVLLCAFIIIQAVLTLLVSLIFFDYQATEFTINDFGYLMASLGLEIIVYLFIAALLTFFMVFMKNSALAIVMYFAVNFVMIIVGSITQTAIVFADTASIGYKILEFFNSANVFVTTMIGGGTSYQINKLLYLLLPNVSLIILLVLLGVNVFNKKDLK